MAIRTASEEDKVENRQLHAVLGSEGAHQVFLVQVRELLRVFVVDMGFIDRVHFGGAQIRWNLAEQLIFQKTIVAVLVVERDGALVCEKDLPLGKLGSVLRTPISRSKE